MTDETDRLRRLRALFDAVIDLPPAERRAALESHAAVDAGLVREVAALIGEAERTAPALATGRGGSDAAAPGDALGPGRPAPRPLRRGASGRTRRHGRRLRGVAP
ncbi:MAG: hypothetical protein IPM94_08235 [bacterium]|nr:hypothetical protein [bacterium]